MIFLLQQKTYDVSINSSLCHSWQKKQQNMARLCGIEFLKKSIKIQEILIWRVETLHTCKYIEGPLPLQWLSLHKSHTLYFSPLCFLYVPRTLSEPGTKNTKLNHNIIMVTTLPCGFSTLGPQITLLEMRIEWRNLSVAV